MYKQIFKNLFCFLFIFSIIFVPLSVNATEIDYSSHITNFDIVENDEIYQTIENSDELNYIYKEHSSLYDHFANMGISLYSNMTTRLPIDINFINFDGRKTDIINTYIDLPIGNTSFEGLYVIDIYFRKNCYNDALAIYISPYAEPDIVNYYKWNSRVSSTINGISPAQMYAERVQGFGFNEDSVTYDNAENLFYWGDEVVEYYHYRQGFNILQSDTIPSLTFNLISSPLSDFNVYDYSGEELYYTNEVCGQQQFRYYEEIFETNLITLETSLNSSSGWSNIGNYEYSFNETDYLGFSLSPYSNELLERMTLYKYYMSEFLEEQINIYVCPHEINTIVSDHNFQQSQDRLDTKIEEFESIINEYNQLYKPEFKQDNFKITYQTEVNNFASSTFEPIFNNDLVIKLIITCLTVCLCAYILFGKRG